MAWPIEAAPLMPARRADGIARPSGDASAHPLTRGAPAAFAIDRSDVPSNSGDVPGLAALAHMMPVCAGWPVRGARQLHHQFNEWTPALRTRSRAPGTRI